MGTVTVTFLDNVSRTVVLNVTASRNPHGKHNGKPVMLHNAMLSGALDLSYRLTSYMHPLPGEIPVSWPSC